MYAVIETGGKQYKVEEGEIVFIEKKDLAEGDILTFDKVLTIADGENVTFGIPVVAGATVTAKVIKHGKDKKIRIIKYKSKKGYQKKQGHRQPYTQVQIEKINA